jgi:hypothetical protein
MAKLVLGFGLVLILTAGMGCRTGARATAATPYDPQTGDTFCAYTVTAVQGQDATSRGTQVCLLCPPGTTQACGTARRIAPAQGVEYELASTAPTCAPCAAGAKAYRVQP